MVIKMRAIDAEELHNALFRLGGNISLDAFTRFERLILGAPTIESVKYGRWIETREDYLRSFYCSVCGRVAYFDCDDERYVLFDYCPYCGSKMEGNKE